MLTADTVGHCQPQPAQRAQRQAALPAQEHQWPMGRRCCEKSVGLCLSSQVEPVSSSPSLLPTELTTALLAVKTKDKGTLAQSKALGLTDRLGTKGAVSFGLFFQLCKPESAGYTLPQQSAPSTVQESTWGRGMVHSTVICGQKSFAYEP